MSVLVAALLSLSDDPRWWGEEYRPTRTRGLEDHRDGGLPADRAQEVRAAVFDLVITRPEGAPLPEIPSERLQKIASFILGEDIPDEYGDLIEDIVQTRPSRQAAEELAAQTPHVHTDMKAIVIGAGASGILAAIRLKAMGIDYQLLERDTEAGGAWWANRYPGCGVDTPSYLYSFSFQHADWSVHYGKRNEVGDYMRHVARANGVYDDIRFSTEVSDLVWDDDAHEWVVTVHSGGRTEELRADIVIPAVGQLSQPKIPDLPGLSTFQGRYVHTAQWPEDLDVTGKRVALVGSGASAQQVGPAIADQVESLLIFQRSPGWIAPNPLYFEQFDPAEHYLMEHVPLYLQWYRSRLAWVYNDRVHTSLQIDPEWPEPKESINVINAGHRRYYVRYIESELAGRDDLIEKSIPDYPPFGKRMLMDNGWYRMLRRDDVQLITEAVTEVTPTGVIDSAGVQHEVDIIVFATGFKALDYLWPMRVVGRDGRTTTQTWGEHNPRAYLGITSPNFPNLFFLGGPNTILGHGGSYLTIAEVQMEYVVGILAKMVEQGIATVECKPEAFEDYVAKVDAAHAKMVWTHPGMSNWYRNAQGRITAAIPWRVVDYRNMVKHADLDAYQLTRHRETVPAET